MELRLEIAPLWLRWPIYSSLIFVALLALTWNGKTSELGLTACMAISAAATSVWVLVGRDNIFAAREALKGLTPQQRSQAIHATRAGAVPTDSVVLHAAARLAQPNLGKKGDLFGLPFVGLIAAMNFGDLNRVNMLAWMCLAAVAACQTINPTRLDARAQLLDQATKHGELDPAR
ncbi:Uncharacterised protein [Mycobacteroides abscessus subsp. massiliense]|nr:Uncharacterised protein [Mycobacteroides abscessus subsp. massiliense]SKD37161.1 Uncharacterised protein [Mycobacteroides abscessus subsp. massiliense]SKD46569.1 Uncharacterised protein [Mycobacteroides abscessus subsp. massiliense]SKD49036.1 Uncharacterised protein [Mycobacteroides abscessus subsp. massiliense]SKD58144.1 Uncharacterised protein [Mycobacteroides abscessus subsp. massiliense]